MSATHTRNDSVGIVLAAGHGSRMRSKVPKPLHKAAGKELIGYSVDLLVECGMQTIVVVASPGNIDAISAALGNRVNYAVQPTPEGTAEAVSRGLQALDSVPGTVTVMAADTPLVRHKSLRMLIDEHGSRPGCRMSILTAPDAFGPDLGHIKRADAGDPNAVGPISTIVEARDRDADSVGPAEVNTGVYCFDGPWLTKHINEVPRSPSGEYYLTALASMAAENGQKALAAPFAWADEAMGVNDRQQLSAVEAVLRDRINSRWMLDGVTMVDPATTYIDAAVTIGPDTVIQPNTMLVGRTTIGADCEIGPNSVVRDSEIGDRCHIMASVIEGSSVHADVGIGPYSHLRPQAVIESGVHLGNYVEVKNSRVGSGTAAGHFCYLGDADIGADVNIGAGTITCNYDGVDKHRTVVGDRAFIGSDTMLVAPISVGPQGLTGAGSVVTKNVPPGGRVVGVPARLLPSNDEE